MVLVGGDYGHGRAATRKESKMDRLEDQIDKLDNLEEVVTVSLESGAVNGKELTPTGYVDLLKLRLRIIEDQCILLGLMKPREVIER